MNLLDTAKVVARLRDLPALPTVIGVLLASFANEDIDVSQLARQISRDQVLTARLLRVANSAFYGLQSKVGTINEAIVVLGFRAVRSMVLAVGVGGMFRADSCQGFDPRAYVRHSVATGLAARGLAHLTGHNPELAFTGGILHDIGKLVLASCFAANYAQALAYRAQHDCPLVVAERDILGLDHAQVGAMLADAWRFPPVLRSAVAEHHAPAAATAEALADVIHVANAIAHGLGLMQNADELVMPVEPTAWRRLRLDSEKIRTILAAVADGVDETCLAFSA